MHDTAWGGFSPAQHPVVLMPDEPLFAEIMRRYITGLKKKRSVTHAVFSWTASTRCIYPKRDSQSPGFWPVRAGTVRRMATRIRQAMNCPERSALLAGLDRLLGAANDSPAEPSVSD